MLKVEKFFGSFQTSSKRHASSSWLPFFFLGLGLILFGILLILMPDLLATLVASGFILVGVFIIFVSFQARAVSRQTNSPVVHQWELND